MQTISNLQKQQTLQKQPFLSIDNVSKVYSTPKGPYTVLQDVSLTVGEGEFVCVIGHSGCGKSTLLNMVAGFNTPSNGEVKLNGSLITKPGPDRMMVFQNYALLPWKTVFENVYLAVHTAYPKKSKAEKTAITREHLEMVGLTEAANKRPSQISGGMKQRVAIARALSIRPQMLILDEPFGALDAITKEELQEELLQIWREHRVTVLMITHDIDEALFLADRLVMMTNGPAANIGEVLEIPFARPRVRSQIMEDPRYYDLRNYALDFLFRRFAHDEDETVTPAPATVKMPQTGQKLEKRGFSHPVLIGAATASMIALGGVFLGVSHFSGGAKTANDPVKETVVKEAVKESVPVPVTEKPQTTPTAITEPEILASLQQNLFDKIDQNWQTSPSFPDDLVYRVKVKSDGKIAGYEPISATAKDYVKETPLENLVESATTETGPVAEFQVVFTKDGVLEIKP